MGGWSAGRGFAILALGTLVAVSVPALGQEIDSGVEASVDAASLGIPLTPGGGGSPVNFQVQVECPQGAHYTEPVELEHAAASSDAHLVEAQPDPSRGAVEFSPEECKAQAQTRSYESRVIVRAREDAPAFETVEITLTVDPGDKGSGAETSWEETVAFHGDFEPRLAGNAAEAEPGVRVIEGWIENEANGAILVEPELRSQPDPVQDDALDGDEDPGTVELPEPFEVASPLEAGSDGTRSFSITYRVHDDVTADFEVGFRAKAVEDPRQRLDERGLAVTVDPETGEVTSTPTDGASTPGPGALAALVLPAAALAWRWRTSA